MDRKGHVDSVNVYFSGISRLAGVALEENPGKNIFVLGESVGALISFSMLARGVDFARGLICVSPAFASRLDIRPLDYVKIFSALLYNPRKQFPAPFTAEMCTRDAEYQKAMEKDPGEHRLISAKLAFEITRLQKKSPASAAKITLPTLFLLAGDDKLVDPEVSRKVFGAIASKNKKIIEYPEMRHALSIDIGRERVFKDILTWAAPLLSLSA